MEKLEKLDRLGPKTRISIVDCISQRLSVLIKRAAEVPGACDGTETPPGDVIASEIDARGLPSSDPPQEES